MRPQLDHTIVSATDPDRSVAFLSELLGLEEPGTFAHFRTVETGNGVSLDYSRAHGKFPRIHLAFRVTEAQFDEIFGRIREWDLDYWADPGHETHGEINHHDGGRGVYFNDPDGHSLEILTRPYGSGPTAI